MVPEISVYLPNVPGQFSRVLKALAGVNASIRGFSVDLVGAVSELHLLFTDMSEAANAKKELSRFQYEVVERQLLLLSRPDRPGELLKVAEIMAANSINVEWGYVALGQTETGDVLFAVKVADGKAQLAKGYLEAAGIKDHDTIPDVPRRK